MQITSPAFEEGGSIPVKYTCDGSDVSPQLSFAGIPDETASLALIVDDPDAPREEPWVHWLIWNLPVDAAVLPEGYPPSGNASRDERARQGTNDFGNEGYGGPCPPPGHDAHRYRFTLYALDTQLKLEAGADRDPLEDAMEGHVVEEDRYTGRYERQ